MQFSSFSEEKISKAILKDWTKTLENYLSSDVIIVGAGPSGLMAGREISKRGFKVLIVEANNFLGGGFWVGGFLMNVLTFRSPSEEILQDLKISYEKFEEGLFVSNAPLACSTLIRETILSGAKVLNLTRFEDLILREGKVCGAVLNSSLINYIPKPISALDPLGFEAKVVIDATGHDAVVCQSLKKRGLLEFEKEAPMDVLSSEELVVEKTGEVFPGLIVTGMATATVFSLPRMGPTFGGMLYSGKRAAEVAIKLITQ
ncbi:MAG: sulfide-dependent adenosine diphosphate thiazole synthase [Thermoanaerobaculia bacterium]